MNSPQQPQEQVSTDISTYSQDNTVGAHLNQQNDNVRSSDVMINDDDDVLLLIHHQHHHDRNTDDSSAQPSSSSSSSSTSAAAGITRSNTTTTRSSLLYLDFLRILLLESHGGWQIMVLALVFSSGMGSTIGVVPSVMTNQFATLHFYHHHHDDNIQHPNYGDHWYRNKDQDESLAIRVDDFHFFVDCSNLTSTTTTTTRDDENMTTTLISVGMNGSKREEEACAKAADDAQQAAAVSYFGRNMLTLLCNSVLASWSDVHGRKYLLVGSLILALLPAIALFVTLLSQSAIMSVDHTHYHHHHHLMLVHPFWYYGADACTGAINIMALSFVILTDLTTLMREEQQNSSHHDTSQYRASSLGLFMGIFYMGFCFAPSLASVMTHVQVSIVSLLLYVLALVFGILFVPETNVVNKIHQDNTEQDELRQHHASSSIIDERNPTTDESRPLLQSPTISAVTEPLLPSSRAHQQDETTTVGNIMEVDQQQLQSEEVTISGSCCFSIRDSYCCIMRFVCTVLLRPLYEMSILNRNKALRLLAVGSFVSGIVFAADSTLVIYFAEEYLMVRDNDLARMFFVMGIVAVVMQAVGLSWMIRVIGGGNEKPVLVLTFVSGTIHNLLYGLARNKIWLYVALSLSQITKVNFPLLSSMASAAASLNESERRKEQEERRIQDHGGNDDDDDEEEDLEVVVVGQSDRRNSVGVGEQQGRLQGALFAVSAMANAIGPLLMEWVHRWLEHTWPSDSMATQGGMFLVASFLYCLGTIAISFVPETSTT